LRFVEDEYAQTWLQNVKEMKLIRLDVEDND
jgi:hypothetical protein